MYDIETKVMLFLVIASGLIMGWSAYNYHPTKEQQCHSDCTDQWSGFKDWTCIKSCMKGDK